MRIELFDWDNDNICHIERHGLYHEEVDEILDYDYRTVQTRNGCYILYGRSAAGRYLAVVVKPIGNQIARVITARDMTMTEKRRYGRLL